MELEEKIRIVAKVKNELNKRSAKLFNLMVSGSHLYGFPSIDSDIDLRGIFVYNTNKFLGLESPDSVITLKIDNYDIVLFELQKALKLIFKGNCNELEHLMAEPVYTTLDFLELQGMIILNKKGLYNSYKGLSSFNYKKFIMKGRKNTVKKYLYVFRGLMAGIHVLETGIIQANIEKLNKHFKIPEIKVLLKLKREGKEKDPIPDSLDTGTIEVQIDKLFKRIDKAYQKSKLIEPDEEDRRALNEFLIKIRKKHLDT